MKQKFPCNWSKTIAIDDYTIFVTGGSYMTMLGMKTSDWAYKIFVKKAVVIKMQSMSTPR